MDSSVSRERRNLGSCACAITFQLASNTAEDFNIEFNFSLFGSEYAVRKCKQDFVLMFWVKFGKMYKIVFWFNLFKDCRNLSRGAQYPCDRSLAYKQKLLLRFINSGP